MSFNFTDAQIERYSRHIILKHVGGKGQAKLLQARVLLIGAGGLGSPVALYLAAAGVGKLGIVDCDVVDVTNLQRQVLHGTSDVGTTKVESAVKRLKDINPDTQVMPHNVRLSSENIMDIVAAYDIVVDGTDNFPTRYLVNDACVMSGKPNVYGSIFLFEGQATVFQPGKGCYRCVFPTPPAPGSVPSCREAGVLGVLPGVVGCIQATEVIKLILGIGEPLTGNMLYIDTLDMSFHKLKLRRNSACPVCGDHPTITRLIDYDQFCGIPGAAH